MYSHLTNTSINKVSPFLEFQKEEVGPGCKWTLQQLRDHLYSKGIDFQKIWSMIKGQILLTLIPICQDIPLHEHGLFELYGFDFLIDEELKSWILEVNLSPALSIDSDIDVIVKKVLLF
jgi:tubulin polyglutamylase TTLL2